MPASVQFLPKAIERGHRLSSTITELEAALLEAIARDTAHPQSVRQVLELRREEAERRRRGLERRLRNAHLGRFKPLSDFDWQWPKRCDQSAVAEMMSLDFI